MLCNDELGVPIGSFVATKHMDGITDKHEAKIVRTVSMDNSAKMIASRHERPTLCKTYWPVQFQKPLARRSTILEKNVGPQNVAASRPLGEKWEVKRLGNNRFNAWQWFQKRNTAQLLRTMPDSIGVIFWSVNQIGLLLESPKTLPPEGISPEKISLTRSHGLPHILLSKYFRCAWRPRSPYCRK